MKCMRLHAAAGGALLVMLAPITVGAAQPVEAPIDAPVPNPAAPLTEMPAGTMIEIRIDEAVNSKTHKTGDWFAISLSQPLTHEGTTLIPAGTQGRGQVVHAAKSSWGGKAGELILAARYLELNGQQIALRGLKMGARGQSNETVALVAGAAATPLTFVITGKNADIASGTLATAKLSAPLALGAAAPSSPPSIP